MTHEEFKKQFDRMVTEYGDKSYGPQKTALIWREVQALSMDWFSTTIDQLLATERYAPLPSAFADAASDERNRIYQKEKLKNKNEAESNFRGLPLSEQAVIWDTLKTRVRGEFPEESWVSFLSLIRDIPSHTPRGCRRCDNEGVVLEPGNVIYRCYCSAGQSRREKWATVP